MDYEGIFMLLYYFISIFILNRRYNFTHHSRMPKHVTFNNKNHVRVMEPYNVNKRGVRVNHQGVPIDNDNNLLFQTNGEHATSKASVVTPQGTVRPNAVNFSRRKTRREWNFSQALAKAEQDKAIANAKAKANTKVNAESRADRIQRLVGVSEDEFNKNQMKYFGKIIEYGGFPISVDKYLDHLESHPNAAKFGGRRKTRKRMTRRTRKH